MEFTTFKFYKTSEDNWATPHAYREYEATIERTEGVGYTLTITGVDAPSPEVYDTLRNAQNAFRKFLLDKPIA